MSKKNAHTPDIGYAIPGKNNVSDGKPDDSEGSYKRLLGDKPITLLWLLQHYSKENVAAYKLQQEQNGKKNRKKDKIFDPKEPDDPARELPLDNPVPPIQDAVIPQTPVPSENEPHFVMSEGTVILDVGQLSRTQNSKGAIPVLESIRYQKDVEIDTLPFVIGREPDVCNLAIPSNIYISAKHAVINCRNGIYFIIDNNSSNHVFVDGHQVTPEIEVLIKDGTNIRFANEEFIFRIMR